MNESFPTTSEASNAENLARPNTMSPLNPADYFTLVMDHEIRDSGMAGSLGGFAIELESAPDINRVRQRVDEFTQRFPIACARLLKQGRQYYWNTSVQYTEILYHHVIPQNDHDQDFQQRTLEKIMNQVKAADQLLPLEFHLITGKHKNVFFLRWLHPLSDARGADLILKYLITDDSEERQKFANNESDQLVTAQLSNMRWWKKIILFAKASYYIRRMDKLKSVLPVGADDPPKKLAFRICRFDKEQTANIARLARKQVGMIGTTLYYMGCFMRAIDAIGPAQDGDAYCVPYAMNLRKQRALSPVFGNQVSVLFAQAERRQVQERGLLFSHLKQQNAQAIRDKIDFAFLPLMQAGSWLSPEKYGKFLRQTPKGEERSSFWFSDIGESDLTDQTFFGHKIVNMFHLCQMTAPPSIALLVGVFDGQLTLSYNYLVPHVSEKWLDNLHHQMIGELLTEDG